MGSSYVGSIAKKQRSLSPLQVGNVGLTVTEQYSHMALWCVAGAPLLACCKQSMKWKLASDHFAECELETILALYPALNNN